MVMDTSLSASLVPYHSDRRSISTMGDSKTGAACDSALRARPISMLATIDQLLSYRLAGSDGRRRVHAPQAIAQGDGKQVQHHDDQQQEQRGREDHGPGGIHVGRLEADVEDVKAEMHEFPLQVQKGPG